MRRQLCRVDSLCDHSMPEETHPVRGEAPASSIPRSVRRSQIRVPSNAGVELLRLHDKIPALR
jgi:hypothetical protein